MDRKSTLLQLEKNLPNEELSRFALDFGITIEKNGKLNKGWVGQTIERLALLSNSNLPERDGTDFELKTTRVVQTSRGWEPKETIKITNLSLDEILTETFETSVFWQKLQRLIIVGCEYESPKQCRAVLWRSVDIEDPKLVSELRKFWEEVRYLISVGEFGNSINLGTSDHFVQLRPTGTGKMLVHCPITGEKIPARAFYATKRFLKKVFTEA